MPSIVEEVNKIMNSNSALEQSKEYVKTVETWEKAGLVTKPLTPMRDARVIVPNKPTKTVSFSVKGDFY